MKLTRTKGSHTKNGNRVRGHIPVRLKLSRKATEELEAYTDHLGLSLNWLVHKLILDELVENRVLQERFSCPDNATSGCSAR